MVFPILAMVNTGFRRIELSIKCLTKFIMFYVILFSVTQSSFFVKLQNVQILSKRIYILIENYLNIKQKP